MPNECSNAKWRHTIDMQLSASSVLVVGCTHSNTGWLKNHVLPAAKDLEVDAVLVTGDFGYWPSNQKFINTAARSYEKYGVEVWFIDGNHEDFPRLKRSINTKRPLDDNDLSPVCLDGSLYYIPRGAYVSVGGLKVIGVGGAVSIDRLYREPGISWFQEEEVTKADLDNVSFTGHADVMVSHDAPSGWAIPGLIPVNEMTKEWIYQLPACNKHRSTMREAFEAVTPKLIMHSHYHTGYDLVSKESWGDVEVVGIDRDDSSKWGRVLSSSNNLPHLSDWVTWPASA